ncbi:hypothetical protein TTHT_0099 [Thermotomaculum hydrothermale]|uniref:DUF2007 domain-containing protein n=1 Tax=Thermotomaculum hydrothermale TaxID=981385 RepID=A0A7R6PMA8_9BACT|nr:DUF2007 domain-containing protein [Thermotomaculum hydrothermale]BBB31746.1 hypothetical protein TTHT_0099 [Thermotomaculum hydrothermale]
MSKFIEIKRFSKKDEAEIVKGFLESNDIEAFVEDKGTQMIPETFGDLAVYRLLVKEEDFDKAKKLLEDFEKED